MKKLFILSASLLTLTTLTNASTNVNAVNVLEDNEVTTYDPNYGYHPYSDQSVVRPQMGFSTWNNYREKIDEVKLTEAAQTMVDLNLNDHHYQYFNIDDCWQAQTRDSEGNIQWNAVKFPSKEGFVQKVKGLDTVNPLKVGLYSSTSELTCEDLVGSYYHEEQDAKKFAEWQIDFLKYDYCHVASNEPDSPGWEYNKNAPNLDYIQINREGMPEGPRYEAENEAITIRHNVSTVSKNGNTFITNLSNNQGSLTYKDIYVEEAGTYNLLVGFQKDRNSRKRYDILINGTDWYDLETTASSGWSDTATHVLKVRLEAGTNTIKFYNNVYDQSSDSIRRYSKMGLALQEATREYAMEMGVQENKIFYNICEHGRSKPWEWAHGIGNSWRTGHDISASWGSIKDKYEETIKLADYQKPGGYNDADMMQVGNAGLTLDQEKAHFTLWSVMNSPLMLGMDIRKLKANGSNDANNDGIADDKEAIYNVITNDKIISLNQEYLLQAKRVQQQGNIDILVKPMKENEITLVFFNKGASVSQGVNYDLNRLATDDNRVTFATKGAYNVSDLWVEDASPELVMSNSISSGQIPANGVKVLHVKAVDKGEIERGYTVGLSNLPSYIGTNETVNALLTVENIGNKTPITLKEVSAKVLNSQKADISSQYDVTFVDFEEVTLEPLEKKDINVTIVVKDTVKNTNNNAKVDTNALEITSKVLFAEETTENIKVDTYGFNLCDSLSSDEILIGDATWVGSTNGESNKQPTRNQKYNGNGKKITLGGIEYQKGFGLNAPGSVTMFINGEYYLSGVFGIDDNHGWRIDDQNWGGLGTVPDIKLIIKVDGKVIYTSEKLTPPDNQGENTYLNLSEITGENFVEGKGLKVNGRVLEIIFDDCGKNNYDHASFGDAKLTKIKGETR